MKRDYIQINVNMWRVFGDIECYKYVYYLIAQKWKLVVEIIPINVCKLDMANR